MNIKHIAILILGIARPQGHCHRILHELNHVVGVPIQDPPGRYCYIQVKCEWFFALSRRLDGNVVFLRMQVAYGVNCVFLPVPCPLGQIPLPISPRLVHRVH